MKPRFPPGLERAPRVSLVQLRSLEAVVRLGSVSRAAERAVLASPRSQGERECASLRT